MPDAGATGDRGANAAAGPGRTDSGACARRGNPGASRSQTDTGSSPEFLVFGVVSEYCVLRAAEGLLRRGYRVSLIEDAIQSLDEKKGREILADLESRGARLITTEQALGLIRGESLSAAAAFKT